MDLSIAALLTQDGITNGAVYALLALALVLVFAVTRVVWIPSGEFVAYGTLTLAGLQLGKPPGTIGLLVGVAIVAAAVETIATARRGEWRRLPRRLAAWLGIPLAVAQAMTGMKKGMLAANPIAADGRWYVVQLDDVRATATEAADAAFPPERLLTQQQQIMRRLEQLDQPKRVELFYQRNVHLTERGHRVVADALFQFLESNRLVMAEPAAR